MLQITLYKSLLYVAILFFLIGSVLVPWDYQMERNDSEYGQLTTTLTTMQHDFLCLSEAPNRIGSYAYFQLYCLINIVIWIEYDDVLDTMFYNTN